MPSKTATVKVADVLRSVSEMSPDDVQTLLKRMALELRVPITIRSPDLSPPGVTVTLEFWRREQAKAALDANVKNRTERDRRTLGYFRNIVTGQWPFVGDSIRFDWDGKLLDGQHRMKAVLRAAEAAEGAGLDPDTAGIWVIVVRGLPPEAQDSIDIGGARNAGDQLKLAGFDYASQMATLARMIITLGSAAPSLPGVSTIRPTDPEVQQLVRQLSGEMTECIGLAQEGLKRARELKLMPRAVQYALWEFRSYDQKTADGWLEWLVSGADMSEGHPVMVLRRYLLNPRRRKLSALDQLDLFHQSWNALQSGESRPHYELPVRPVRAPELTPAVYVKPPLLTVLGADDVDLGASDGPPAVVFAAAAAG
jgi:hypothetical protein